MKGFLNIVKAPGVTSSTIVSLVKHIIGMKKVGHAGTLDPSACGVLPIMIGKAAKLFDYLSDDGKEYVSEFVFGIDTDSLDMQGKVINTKKCIITKAQIQSILPKFIGKIKQYPPKVSALSINGVKAYSLQRQGIEFDVPQREVTIDYIELIRQTGYNKFLFRIGCSKGTYIRSICRDMARMLNTYAYISYLNRTKNGFFKIEDGYSIEQLREIDISRALIPIDKPISHMKRVDIAQKDLKKVINGVTVRTNRQFDAPFCVYYNDVFIGLGRQESYNDKRYIKVYKRLVEEEDYTWNT